MKVTVLIDQTYSYDMDASSVRIAINRACAVHDISAKKRQKAGFQTPRTLSQMARQGQLRIFATVTREQVEPDAPKRPRAVRRGPIRAR